ncbi:hypothetical protein FJZ53_03425 [Candidatus Woesearchaeota archaeon]|nr:hypothetical protein [Candidatus Woesearchaeota archaeon]
MIALITLLLVASFFSFKTFKKFDTRLDETIKSERNIIQGDALQLEDNKAKELYSSALPGLDYKGMIESRILFREWSEVERKYVELAKISQFERNNAELLNKKIEDLRSLIECLEKKAEKLLSSKGLTYEEAWRLQNFMGCLKLYKILFVQGDEETRKRQTKGLVEESISCFKNSINIIEDNKLTGTPTDIPRWNLELLIKRQKGEGEGEGKPEQGEKEGDQLQKVIPLLGSPGVQGGIK